MHVEDVFTTYASGTPGRAFTRRQTVFWRAKVVDQIGAAVSGASGTSEMLKPSGDVLVTRTSTTGADGWALFSHATLSRDHRGTYPVRVTAVAKSGATYDPAANIRSSTTFTLE